MSTLPLNFTLLQVIPDLETGGAEQSTLDVAEAVVRDGSTALVASRGGRMVRRLDGVGARWIRMPVHTKNPIVGFANVWRLVGLIRRHRVSLVHVRSRAPAFSVFLASRLTGVPMAATYHGAYPARSGFKRWYNSIMTRGELVIANSEFTRAHLMAQHDPDPARVVTIPRGVDLRRFTPEAVGEARRREVERAFGLEASDHRTRILLPGRLTRLKGQSVLIDAAAALWRDGRRDFIVLMVGDAQGRDAYREALERRISEAGLSEAVRLAGHCDDMPAAFLASDLVAIPSTVPETFGRTAVEALAMERPVIASALGGLIETVEPGVTGWLAPAGDVDAWTAALQQALAAPIAHRLEMGRLGRERVARKWTVEAMTEATLQAYAEVIARRPGGARARA